VTKRGGLLTVVLPGGFIFGWLLVLASKPSRLSQSEAVAALVVLATVVTVLVRLLTTPGAWNEKLGPPPAQPKLRLRPWVRSTLMVVFSVLAFPITLTVFIVNKILDRNKA
jgi:hypothetical protein